MKRAVIWFGAFFVILIGGYVAWMLLLADQCDPDFTPSECAQSEEIWRKKTFLAWLLPASKFQKSTPD